MCDPRLLAPLLKIPFEVEEAHERAVLAGGTTSPIGQEQLLAMLQRSKDELHRVRFREQQLRQRVASSKVRKNGATAGDDHEDFRVRSNW